MVIDNENINSAQTNGTAGSEKTTAAVPTPTVAEVGQEPSGQNGGIDPAEKAGNEAGQNGAPGAAAGEAATGKDNAEGKGELKPPQTRKENAEFARARREAERQAEIKKAKESAIIETLGGENPYTHEPMKDSADVDEYLAMKEIEKNGGDPLGDYHKFRKERDRAAAVQAEEKRKKDEWYSADAASFRAENPDVDISELISDAKFQKFAKGKLGIISMKEIYADYKSFISEAENAAKTVTAQMLANAKATPGALATSYTPEADYFTREQVSKMSQAEVTKNYDKIRESMKKW